MKIKPSQSSGEKFISQRVREQEIAKEQMIQQKVKDPNTSLGITFDKSNHKITNDFMKEETALPLRLCGSTQFKTTNGYFKNGKAILTGKELYLYNSNDADNYSSMFILTKSRLLS